MVFKMNDRAVNLLANYDIEVIRVWKGRSAILCETSQGIKILKEYSGLETRLEVQNTLLNQIKENGYPLVEDIVRNKEGSLISKDMDQVSYVLKTYFTGKECNIKEVAECKMGVRSLAKLHCAMELPEITQNTDIPVFTIHNEFEKRNKELKKVNKYIKEKGKKTEFERYLQQNINYFIEKALQITEQVSRDDTVDSIEQLRKKGFICHGDYQHHNLIMEKKEVEIINFEKFAIDNQVRDLYQFMRKILEKNNWNIYIGLEILEAYQYEQSLTIEDKRMLYYRFAYPEKFWKIVNFYFNSGKSFISMKNLEKLEKLLKQDQLREEFLKKIQ
ncbi:MAG: CotS family spore coat protein [Eubacteriales bacterium]